MAMYLATHAAHTTAAACVSTAIASLLSVKLPALQDTTQASASIVGDSYKLGAMVHAF